MRIGLSCVLAPAGEGGTAALIRDTLSTVRVMS